ncbi:MAG TPA: hypothetical protein PLM49_02240 [Bacteroidales bacterium]|nr:hypothetical protein [Bacteroidales bacterium]
MQTDNNIEKKDTLTKGEGFTTPENYFGELPNKVMKHIAGQQENRKTRIIDIVMPYVYIAAGFVFLGLLIRGGLGLLVDKNDLELTKPVQTSKTLNDNFIEELVTDDIAFYEVLAEMSYVESTYAGSEDIEDYLLSYDLFYEIHEE